MKKFLRHPKRIFAFLLALSLGMGTAYAYNFSATYSGKTFYFNIINSSQHYVEITYPGTSSDPWGGYTKPSGNITLPSTVTYGGITYTVTKIGDDAFWQCNGLSGSLTIPNSVTTIGEGAFLLCSNLKGSLTIPNSVTTIGDGAFYNVGFTGSLTIPSSVTYIGMEAFYGCTGLTGSLSIPNSVTTLGMRAFNGCSGFTGSLTIGTGVTSIGAIVFNGCSGFTQVNYNATNCADLISSDQPFADCSGTLTIGSNVQRVPAYLFNNCTGFTGSLTIPSSVTTIGDCAFQYCSNFTSMTVLPVTPPTLGTNVFQNVPTSIPVTVPCESFSAYQSATGWSAFTNMQCLPYDDYLCLDDFETSCDWQLINGNCTNKWVWGEAGTRNNHYLYISDNDGTSNHYTINSSTMVYAAKLFHFEEGWYRFQYDWLAYGEKNWDYLRVALVPASVTLSAGTSVPSGFSYQALPTGWIALDGGAQLNQNAWWQTTYSEISVPSGDYYMVFAWRNDSSVGNQPPAAIDNVSIRPITCIAPTELTAQHVGATQVILDWTPVGGEDEWQVWLSWDNGNETLYVPYTANTHPFTLTGLTAGRTYTANVYAVCGPDDASLSSNEISFTTSTNPCDDPVTFPFEENFDGYTGTTSGSVNILPDCWSRINNTTATNYMGYPSIFNASSYAHSGTNFLFFRSQKSNDPQDIYAILPYMDDVKYVDLSFYARTYDSQTYGELFVGVMTDPTDASTFVPLFNPENLPTTYDHFVIDFVDYTGEGHYIAIKMPAANNLHAYCAVCIDDLTVTLANIVFADAVVKQICVANWDTNNDGELSYAEAAAVTSLGETFQNAFQEEGTSVSFNELQYFTGLTEIGMQAFSGCWYLSSITLPSSVTTIGNYTFAMCISLTSITLPNTVTTIGDNAFMYCYGLTAIELPDALTTLGFGVFNHCTGLTSVEIPAFVTSIGMNPFSACNNLASITVAEGNTVYSSPNNNAIVETATHTLITGLSSTLIPDDIQTISQFAFSTCTGLTSIVIPASVTNIYYNAFEACSNLAEITVLAEMPPVLGFNVFQGVPTTIPVYVSCESLEDYQTYDNGSPWGGFTNIQCHPYDDFPYVNDFETSCGWRFINGDLTNQWVWGEASTRNNHYFYISDNDGTSNQYTINSATMVYAAKLLHFEEGWYRFQYDWLAYGEKNWDYLRVALVPASVTLSAGTSVPSGFSYQALPTGWIALDGGAQLNQNAWWQTTISEIEVPTGDYLMVFAWRNDSSVGNQPPAAIDNVSITPVTCLAPTELTTQHVGATQVTLDWTPSGDEDEWRVWLSWDNGNETLYVPYTAETHPFTIIGLTTGITYTANVYALCGPDDASLSSNEISFTTSTNPCDDPVTFPFTENFDGYTGATSNSDDNVLPDCWSRINTTTDNSFKIYPSIYTYSDYAQSGTNFMFFQSSYIESYYVDPQDQYAILPPMDNVANLELSLYARIPASGRNATFMVGVMTDPTDASTFTELASYQPTSTAYTYYSIPLSLYTGNGTYIAIKMPAASSEVLYRGVCIDDVSVTENPCLAPTDLTVTDITASSATLDWTGDQASYNVRYKVSGDFFDGFENGLIGWTTIRNGEGTSNTDWIWMNSTSSYSHNGNCFVQSRSWYDNVSYSVDNWLITPRVTLEGTLSFWVRGDGNYPDKYYVCVSTTQPAIDAFAVLGDARYPTGEWAEVIVDLSAYAGQQGYIAIRHQDSDKDYLWIDDFGISIGSEWLELNGVTNPVTIQNLIPGTTYEWQVQGCDCNGVGSLTEWSGVHSFITSLCSPEDQCELTFMLTDSYGDGWNGAAINVVDVESGLSLGLMSNQNLDGTTGEETQTVTLPVCDGRELRFEWVSGNWDSECSYVVTDLNGNEVFSGTGAMTEPFTYTVSCDAVQVQTVALTAGLNWFSTGTEITLEDLQAALVATGNTSIMIASQSDGKTTYANGRWRGQLSTLDVKQMYKITVGTACEIALEGAPVNPAEHPVTIHNGSNWIGFPLGTSMTLTDAFVGFAVNGDMVVSQSNGSATYTGGRWRGSLTTLEPGKGYNYKSASSTTKVLWFGLGHACVDLGLPSGLLWATCNVGANAPEEYGDYFAWGETQPKDNYSYGTYQHCIGSRMTKYCNNSNFGYNGFTDNLTSLEPSDDAATANWGNGWRMPTQAEWQELVDNTTITWTTQNGVNGWLFTSSNSNSLFLPAAGCRSNSSLYYAGSESYYWSSSLYTDYPDKAWAFYYYDENYVDFLSREEGASVRPVRSVRN